MKRFTKIFFFLLYGLSLLTSQSNFSLSDPACLDLLKGNFKADSFADRELQANENLSNFLVSQINADSLHRYLAGLVSFNNRNTIADQLSKPTEGILGARNWIRSYLNYWSNQEKSVLIPCEFEFDFTMCSRIRHRELFAIIPGTGALRDELVIVEAHLDSRCEDVCDTLCVAQGADDNGSGSSLLMELTRHLSKVKLNRTLVILWVTGEEQGLGGSRSFATFCKQNGIKIKAVFNNDIVGGIECGVTSSPPSCPGPNLMDSLRLRIFSAGTTNSMPKNLARLTRILVEENLMKAMPLAPKIDIMFGEDRSGRGSDHIPFREQGYPAIRFTSSYEHGDGNPTQVGYTDRQHSTRDILGKDLNGDGIFDSLYVNFNYLRNNTIVNALSAVNAASSNLDAFTLVVTPKVRSLNLKIENPQAAKKFVFGVRRINSAYFDTVIISDQPEILIEELIPTQYYITACGIDSLGWISMFGQEYNVRVFSLVEDTKRKAFVELLQNKPNPFDEQTLIPIFVNDISNIKTAELMVTSADGRIVKKIELQLIPGINELIYDYNWHNYECGIFYYSLFINGQKVDTKKMELVAY
ncbi:MAG: M28 family peptidase [Saprospiraceae bacterium]|nr:M28 family peptidase [Saprospiraceae bacterium]MBK9728361.1 M28 family peptidase [Saprospiraceae bacterium]